MLLAANGSTRFLLQKPRPIIVSGGRQGVPGAPGASGGAWLFVTGVPSNALGSDGQTAYSTDTGNLYNKVAGVWVLQGQITGQQLPSRELVIPITTNGAQTAALPNANTSLGIDILINGVKEPRTEFTATATLLTLPASLNLLAGDVVTVLFK